MIVDVAHPLPRSVGRSAEHLVDALLADAVLEPDFLHDRFLTLHGQGHIDAVESHPVDLLLPPFPIPVRRGVAEGADVVVEPEFMRRSARSLIA